MFQAEQKKINILKSIVCEGGGWRGYGLMTHCSRKKNVESNLYI